MYKITIAEMKPTPRPQMSLPATMTPRPVEAVSRMQPIEKMKQPPMIVPLRPMKSAKSPAMICRIIRTRSHVCRVVVILDGELTAPKNVPAERIEVTKDWSWAGRTKAFTAAALLGSGYGRPVYCWMKKGIPSTPPIHPVAVLC